MIHIKIHEMCIRDRLEEFYRTILDEKIPVMLMEGREYDKIKGESWFITVSYTHLDVYKRQEISSLRN